MNKFLVICSILLSFLFSSINEISIDNCVHFSANTDRMVYYKGENLFLELNISIEKGFHIYSVDPAKSLSPSFIEFPDSSLFSTIGIIHEPKTHTKYSNKLFII